MAETQKETGWRVIIASSSIMSLALLGDALLYAVLPVYAADFGLTLPWVGVMLSVNRIVRVFAYGWIARAVHRFGVRSMCITAAFTATVSTAIYGVAQGPEVILLARILWGLTYAVLVLATLSYAVQHRASVGTRVGASQAIQRIGPIVALLGGAWLVGHVGPNAAFAILAVPTAFAILIALRLPPNPGSKAPTTRAPALGRPKPVDVLFFLQGYGVDGVFAISITLILARNTDVATAVLEGSALLAMRHFGEVIAAPLFGWIADRMGAARVFAGAAILTLMGFVLVATGWVVLGALIMLLFRGALASLGPAVITQGLAQDADPIAPLARMQAWRDLGAALGPLITGMLLATVSPELQHAAVAGAMGLALIYWYMRKPNALRSSFPKMP